MTTAAGCKNSAVLLFGEFLLDDMLLSLGLIIDKRRTFCDNFQNSLHFISNQCIIYAIIKTDGSLCYRLRGRYDLRPIT